MKSTLILACILVVLFDFVTTRDRRDDRRLRRARSRRLAGEVKTYFCAKEAGS